MGRFRTWLEDQDFGPFADYHALHKWSIDNLETFWNSVWNYCGLVWETPATSVLGKREMPGAEWFPGMRLNFAANLLRLADDHGEREAVVSYCETRPVLRRTYAELKSDAGALEAFLRTKGIKQGDRIAGVVTNGYEALVGMLATTSLGAIWSSASPDFGVGAILDRFGQIEPAALIVVNGYGYGGKVFARQSDFAGLVEGLPTVKAVVSVQQLPDEAPIPGNLVTTWDDALAQGDGQTLSYTPLPPDHPVYILYSSGTTGKPKCIVHGAAGLLVNHAKELMLHGDVGHEDRFLYFTTCGWMMWNWMVTGLATGCKLVLFDGSPFAPAPTVLWKMADEEQISVFGTSAKYIAALEKADVKPGRDFDLSSLKAVLSTGSPLAHESFDYVYREIKQDLQLSSISGGTDIVSCFALGSPILPVWAGELQCRGLAMAVDIFDDEGQPLRQQKGELVCTKPFPSMPIGFWNDPDNSRFTEAYFSQFDNIWAHGDYGEITAHDGVIIHGRSDAVLNPGGVRIGTAEIYRQVEKVDQVLESLCIGQPWKEDVRVVLFVRLKPDVTLDDALIDHIKTTIRANTTPRHVPAVIIQVADIPRTISGKIVELAVRKMVLGETVKNKDALANPEALELFRDLPQLQ
jgi:acetoacetyl-CoA synthetase